MYVVCVCVCVCVCTRGVCVCVHIRMLCACCSGQGETVVSILTDLNGFWTYENREVLLAENQDVGN